MSFACLLTVLFAAASFSQTKSTSAPQPTQQKSTQAKPAAPTQPSADEELPPEDDDGSVRPKTYPFDPLECERNIKVGNFYMHRGRARDYRRALDRYEDATKYDPTSPEAFFKLGEAEEKLKDKDAARTAFQRVVRLAPDSKFAQEAKKKLGG